MMDHVIAQLALWHRRARTRRHLRELDAVLLRDIGIDRTTRDAECARWPWHGAVPGSKENGRCLRAPVSNPALIERDYLRRSRTTTSTRAIS